jgi:hypothetical protein
MKSGSAAGPRITDGGMKTSIGGVRITIGTITTTTMIITTKEVLRDGMQGGLFVRSFSALNLGFQL